MRYYRVNGEFPFLVETQDKAKRAARDLKCDWEPHDVPTDKEGLMEYLNSHDCSAESVTTLVGEPIDTSDIAEADEAFFEKAELVEPTSRREEASFGSSQLGGSYEATDIEEFILDRASVRQVENIFMCLGARFKELANASLLG